VNCCLDAVGIPLSLSHLGGSGLQSDFPSSSTNVRPATRHSDSLSIVCFFSIGSACFIGSSQGGLDFSQEFCLPGRFPFAMALTVVRGYPLSLPSFSRLRVLLAAAPEDHVIARDFLLFPSFGGRPPFLCAIQVLLIALLVSRPGCLWFGAVSSASVQAASFFPRSVIQFRDCLTDVLSSLAPSRA